MKLPNIRKSFFEKVLIIILLLSSILFILRTCAEECNTELVIVSIVATIIYLVMGCYILYVYGVKSLNLQYKNLASLDYKRVGFHKIHKNKAVFLDRDGTIHVDKVMTHKVEDLEFFPDTVDTLKYFKKLGYKLIVITNQSGIAKGVYTEETMHKFNMHMVKELRRNGCIIDAVYYCPHLVNSGCSCSKPNTGMIERAAHDFNIDLSKSFLIGDKMSDIKAGYNAAVKSILVTTGIYEQDDYHKEEGYTDSVLTVSCLAETKLYIK